MPYAISFLRRQFFERLPVPTASFNGKTVIITGSNVGLGLEAARWIVHLGATRVIIACRDIQKGLTAAASIQKMTGCSPDILDVWQIDMGSYASVLAFAERVQTELPRLDVLIANAGINSSTFRLAEDNEAMVTVNVVSLFLLGFLLYPKLRETASQYQTKTHFTVTSSDLHEIAKFEESQSPSGKIFASLSDKSKFQGTERYATSKLMEILIIRQMALLLPLESRNVIVNCVSPGMCHSELTREFDSAIVRCVKSVLARTTEVGSRALVCGASSGEDAHGKYMPDCKIEAPMGVCQGKNVGDIQARLWEELQGKLEAIRPGVTNLA